MHTRHDEVSTRLKNLTRHGIIDRLSHYTLETTTQEFFAKSPSGQVLQGVNIVGVIPGRNRNKPENQNLKGAEAAMHQNLVDDDLEEQRRD